MKPYLLLVPLLAMMLQLAGEEVIFHSGPPVSTPASTPVTPVRETGTPPLIHFQREFFVERDLLDSLPRTLIGYEKLALSAVDAIKLATDDAGPESAFRSFQVTELKLLQGPEGAARPVDYYLVSMLANGSEVHRIVLMNGQVLSPRLRRVEK